MSFPPNKWLPVTLRKDYCVHLPWWRKVLPLGDPTSPQSLSSGFENWSRDCAILLDQRPSTSWSSILGFFWLYILVNTLVGCPSFLPLGWHVLLTFLLAFCRPASLGWGSDIAAHQDSFMVAKPCHEGCIISGAYRLPLISGSPDLEWHLFIQPCPTQESHHWASHWCWCLSHQCIFYCFRQGSTLQVLLKNSSHGVSSLAFHRSAGMITFVSLLISSSTVCHSSSIILASFVWAIACSVFLRAILAAC